MWAVSSAFNVLGAMSFVLVVYAIGRTLTMALAATLYLLALAWAAFALKQPASRAPSGT